MLEIEGIDHISDEMRAVVEELWPELTHKLPPKQGFAASAASRAKCSLRAASRNVHQTGIDHAGLADRLCRRGRGRLRVSRARSWYGSDRPIALHLAIAACRRNPASAS
jgi:hypothetical protein